MNREEQAELVRRALAGDPDAFRDLVTAHQAKVWSICLRITGNHADAQDAVQDALTAAWRHLHRFRGDASFGTWLYRIASNASLAIVRRRRDEPAEVQEHWAVTSDRTDEHALRDEVQRLLAAIPEHYRAALVLREYGELTYEEIAVALGIPVQTVKSRIHRARAALVAS